MDTSKRVFQGHGVDASERSCVRKKLGRDAMMALFKAMPPVVIGIEACGSAHPWAHPWARTLSAMGHEVCLTAPQLARLYVKCGRNDAADAEARCEAMSRPAMRIVSVKTVAQQAALLLASERAQLVSGRTRLAHAIRGHRTWPIPRTKHPQSGCKAAEFGLAEAKGVARVGGLLARVAADAGLPVMVRELFAGLGEELAQLEARLAAADARLQAWHRGDEASRRHAAIPGIGPITASLLAMKVPDPHAFKSGRDFAAWLGLTPKDHSTAGRVGTGGIARAGDEVLRSLLVVGATSVIRHMRAAPPPPPKGWRTEAGQTGGGPARADAAQAGTGEAGPAKAGGPRPWPAGLPERKPAKLAAIALASKPDARASSGTARVAWTLLSSGEACNPVHSHAPVPALAAA